MTAFGSASRVVAAVLALAFVGGCASPLATLSTRPSDAVASAEDVARGQQLFPFRAPGGAWGFMTADGEVAVPARFEGASEFREGRAIVEVDGRSGAIDPSGRIVVEPIYDEVTPFADGRARVQVGSGADRRFGFVAPDGQEVVAPTLPRATVFRDGLSVVRLREEKLTLVQQILIQIGGGTPSDRIVAIDENGGVVLRFPHDEVAAFSEGLAAFQVEEGTWGYLDPDGAVVIGPQFEGPALAFSEGLARVGQDGRIGYVDSAGRFVIDPQFDAAGPFSEGLAAVRVGGRWGYVDVEGDLVVEPQFQQAGPFSEGRAAVRLGGVWGYVDADGGAVIEPAYRTARPFRNGLAVVFQGGRPLLVDRAGDLVEPRP